MDRVDVQDASISALHTRVDAQDATISAMQTSAEEQTTTISAFRTQLQEVIYFLIISCLHILFYIFNNFMFNIQGDDDDDGYISDPGP